MTVLYRNTSNQPIVFRDDRPDKQRVEPGGTFVVVGDQHLPLITSLHGVRPAAEPEPLAPDATVADLRARAAELGLRSTSRMSRAELEDAIAELAPDSRAQPEGEPV